MSAFTRTILSGYADKQALAHGLDWAGNFGALARHKIRISYICWAFDANIETTVRCVLVAERDRLRTITR